MTAQPILHIATGHDKSLLRRHPWIFSGAVSRLEGKALPGETVVVRSSQGRFLGRAAWSPRSQIRGRVWSFVENEEIEAGFFQRRLVAAIAMRRDLGLMDLEGACRLVNAESDQLPGLIVDRYGGIVVCQFLAAGVERFRKVITDILAELLQPVSIYERSDVDVRRKEGLPQRSGSIYGPEVPDLVEIQENGLRFLIDVRQGHKTGWYLDQRENRRKISSYVAGTTLLNCFSYTGGFGLNALVADAARVINVDVSKNALDLAARIADLNGFEPGRIEHIRADVFQLLRTFRQNGRTFDRIVLDPPKFAESKKQVRQAARGYKDINRLAFELLSPGGILFTFSCSGLLETTLFQKIVADAALDAGREAKIIGFMGQAQDHPVGLPFPEGLYLKGFICRVE